MTAGAQSPLGDVQQALSAAERLVRGVQDQLAGKSLALRRTPGLLKRTDPEGLAAMLDDLADDLEAARANIDDARFGGPWPLSSGDQLPM